MRRYAASTHVLSLHTVLLETMKMLFVFYQNKTTDKAWI